jgi:hypothetical protein
MTVLLYISMHDVQCTTSAVLVYELCTCICRGVHRQDSVAVY